MLRKFQAAFAEAIFKESIVFGKELEGKGRILCSHRIAQSEPRGRPPSRRRKQGTRNVGSDGNHQRTARDEDPRPRGPRPAPAC